MPTSYTVPAPNLEKVSIVPTTTLYLCTVWYARIVDRRMNVPSGKAGPESFATLLRRYSGLSQTAMRGYRVKQKSRQYPSSPKHPSVRQILSHHIMLSGLTNREIAAACGLGAVNMVTMIKRGHSRLPLERLGAMARTLGIDPYDLFCRWMAECYADTWKDLALLVRRA